MRLVVRGQSRCEQRFHTLQRSGQEEHGQAAGPLGAMTPCNASAGHCGGRLRYSWRPVHSRSPALPLMLPRQNPRVCGSCRLRCKDLAM